MQPVKVDKLYFIGICEYTLKYINSLRAKNIAECTKTLLEEKHPIFFWKKRYACANAIAKSFEVEIEKIRYRAQEQRVLNMLRMAKATNELAVVVEQDDFSDLCLPSENKK